MTSRKTVDGMKSMPSPAQLQDCHTTRKPGDNIKLHFLHDKLNQDINSAVVAASNFWRQQRLICSSVEPISDISKIGRSRVMGFEHVYYSLELWKFEHIYYTINNRFHWHSFPILSPNITLQLVHFENRGTPTEGQ